MKNKRTKNIKHIADTFAIRIMGAENPQKYLVCFPFIGGHSKHFRPLSTYLKHEWKLYAVDPPGHAHAKGELRNNLEDLIPLYKEGLKSYFKQPFYLFGHSMGAIVAYRLLQELEKADIFPSGIFLSAAMTPERSRKDLEGRDKEEFIKKLDLIDERFQIFKEFFAPYEKIFEADYQILLHLNITKTKIKTPMYVLYSKEDNFVDYKNIDEWGAYGENVSYYEIEGKHNYILTNPKEVSETLSNITSC